MVIRVLRPISNAPSDRQQHAHARRAPKGNNVSNPKSEM
jgi:hypothetical protein